MYLDVIFYGLDACSAIASSVFEILYNSIHKDPGTHGVLGCHFLQDSIGFCEMSLGIHGEFYMDSSKDSIVI